MYVNIGDTYFKISIFCGPLVPQFLVMSVTGVKAKVGPMAVDLLYQLTFSSVVGGRTPATMCSILALYRLSLFTTL